MRVMANLALLPIIEIRTLQSIIKHYSCIIKMYRTYLQIHSGYWDYYLDSEQFFLGFQQLPHYMALGPS